MRKDRASSRYLFLPICFVSFGLLATSCATRKDVVNTQSDLATVRGNLQGLGSSFEKKVAGMSEEIQEMKKTLNSLKERDDEFRQAFMQLQQKMNVNKIESDENLKNMTALNSEYQKSINSDLMAISGTIESLGQRLTEQRRKIDQMNTFQNDQNSLLKETANHIKVFIEEASAEHRSFNEGLLDLSRNYNQLVDKINTYNRELAGKINSLGKELSDVQKRIRTTTVRSHVVSEGETLSSIASKYGVSVDMIVNLNSLKDPNNLRIGQIITLPSP